MLRIERLGTITGHGNWASLEPLVIAPPSPHCEVCVIVPVRDEAENLTATLDALARQIDLEGRPFDRERYEIIVLANNCSDDSAAIARCFANQQPTLTLHVVEITLPLAEAYVGRARRILMDEAYRRLTLLEHGRGVIASTDGDTRVAPTWLAATLHEIQKGADAVGGRILTDRAGRVALDDYARLCHLREVGYRYLVAELETYLDPDPYDCWPRHYQHFGASLAVTAQMVRASRWSTSRANARRCRLLPSAPPGRRPLPPQPSCSRRHLSAASWVESQSQIGYSTSRGDRRRCAIAV